MLREFAQLSYAEIADLLLWLALLGIPAWRRYRRAQSLGSLARA